VVGLGKKKQFYGTSKAKKFYDRKVRIQGHSRVISIGHIIPQKWLYVRLEVLERRPDVVIVKITKLLDWDEYNKMVEKE